MQDTKFRACKWACGAMVWSAKRRVCDACLEVTSTLTGGSVVHGDTPEIKAEKERRIERYAELAANKLPLTL